MRRNIGGILVLFATLMEALNVASGRNSLLEAFPSPVRQRLKPIHEDHRSHEVLLDFDEKAEWAWFPDPGTVVSQTRTTQRGATVEVGIVGSEGVVSVQTLLSPNAIGSNAVVQIAGATSRVKLKDLRTALNENDVVRDVLLAATGSFLTQVSQHVLCNRIHTIEQRLAKWLLGVRDRIDSNEIDLTHDFLSHMLGIRRSGVTVAVGALALDGLITHERKSVTITDREGLEERACECYALIRDAM